MGRQIIGTMKRITEAINRLSRNTAVKVLAMFLLTLFLSLTIMLSCGAAALQHYGAYNTKKLTECELLDSISDFKPEDLTDYWLLFSEYALDFDMEYAKEKNGEPHCNTVVLITDNYGNEFLSNYKAAMVPSTVRKLTLSFAFPESGNPGFHISEGFDNCPDTITCMQIEEIQIRDISFRDWLSEHKNINTAGLSDREIEELYFAEYFGVYQDYLYGNEVKINTQGYFNVTLGIVEEVMKPFTLEYLAISGYERRVFILVSAILCGIVSAAAAVFLFISAGSFADSDRPQSTVLERIPLGLFIIFALVAFQVVFSLFRLLQSKMFSSALLFILAALTVCILVFIAVGSLYSLAARFKCEGWTKNTLIYQLCGKSGVVSKSVTDLTVVTACVGGWFVINMLLLAVTLDRLGIGLALTIGFNLIAAVAVVIIATQWQQLKKSTAIIANGDTSHRVDTEKMLRPLKEHGDAINRMGEGVEAAVNEKMKSERMKTDLITNVSHDLKTPLTSIINYVDFLKKEPIENETALKYIDTLDRQATRLKRLIEDLVEASKVTSGNITANIILINANELLEQAVDEYEYRLEQSGISPVLTIHNDKLTALADGRLLWRVFDNLMSNVCKYGLAGTRLYIDARQENDRMIVVFRNISANQLNVPAEELMERFVRGDSSRTTRGNGLGLTIAKTLIELQNGIFSLEIEGDMFKAIVSLPAGNEQAADKSGDVK